MKVWQIILLILSCSFVGFLIFSKLAINTYVDTIDSAKDSANKSTAELIISTIKNAHALAQLKNKNYPTLKQVKEEFNSQSLATWDDDYVIEANGFNCNVEVVNNYLNVTCLESKTSNKLILSN